MIRAGLTIAFLLLWAVPAAAAEPAFKLPPPKLAPDVLARLRAVCGEDGVRSSAFERITHATGATATC